MTYAIKATYHFFGPRTSGGLVTDEYGATEKFATLEAAKKRIGELNDADYYLANNESGRPDYKAVKANS